MDVSTREQWMDIVGRTTAAQPRVANQLLSMVRGLSDITDGFSIDQMQHALQTASLAEQFADVWDQMAFDPDYQSETLEHFEPMVVRVFAQPISIAGY